MVQSKRRPCAPLVALLAWLTFASLQAQSPADKNADHGAWLTMGVGVGTISTCAQSYCGINALGPGGVVDLSYQRGRNLISVGAAGTNAIDHDFGQGYYDASLLIGRATGLKPIHAAFSIGVGRAWRTNHSPSFGLSTAARVAARTATGGLGLYGFWLVGRNQFGGLALVLNVGKLR